MKGEKARLDALGPDGVAQLHQAFEMMQKGQHAQAASVFLTLATKARADNRPPMATRFVLRASKAYRSANDWPRAVQTAQMAIQDAGNMEYKKKAAKLFAPTLRQLRQAGKNAEAQQVES